MTEEQRKLALKYLYTSRWNIDNGGSLEEIRKQTSLAVSVLEGQRVVDSPNVTPPVNVPTVTLPKEGTKGAGLKVIPFAKQSVRRLPTQGKYEKGYPLGAIVHFTAGRWELGLQNAINDINETKYTFLCIAFDGTIVQGHDVDRWGYHAGESKWTNVASNLKLVGSVSDDLIGIEMNNAGKVEKQADGRFKTWFGSYLKAEQVRYVTEAEYGCPTGYYHKYSPQQEETLS